LRIPILRVLPKKHFDQISKKQFLLKNKIQWRRSRAESQILAIEGAISRCEAEIKRLSDLIETCVEFIRVAMVKSLEYERIKAVQLREEKIGWIKLMQYQLEYDMKFSQKDFCSACRRNTATDDFVWHLRQTPIGSGNLSALLNRGWNKSAVGKNSFVNTEMFPTTAHGSCWCSRGLS
jgi:hypothetical protein